MTLLTQILLVITLVLSIILPIGYFLIGERNAKRFKRSIAVNIFFFFGAFLVATIMIFTGGASAIAAATTTATTTAATTAATGLSGDLAKGLGYIAAGLATGLSCVGGGIAVSGAASAALGAISEDPAVLGKTLIFVGLAEGVCLYGLIISFMILGSL